MVTARVWLSFASLLITVSSADNKTRLSCDDILKFAYADLCDLQVEQGHLSIRGLDLSYWRYRNAAASTGHPILVIHGGPAFTHNYMLALKQQACRGREVVFYDQVGCGESSKPRSVNASAPWLLTIDYYSEEVRSLVDHFGWSKFHIIGNSWGTVVAQRFSFEQDPRLQGVVLSGALSDGQLYIDSQWDPVVGSLGSLPLYVQDVLRKVDATQDYDSPLYQAEDSLLTYFFTSRTTPLPDCVTKSEAAMDDPTSKNIYVSMQGPSEFSLGGVLATFNFTPQLPAIRNPVLLTYGRFDTMRPPTIDALYHNLPMAWKCELPRSGHMTMVDDPRLMNDIVGEFFDMTERGNLEDFEAKVQNECGGPRPNVRATYLAASSEQGPWLGGIYGMLAAAVAWLLGLMAGRLSARGNSNLKETKSQFVLG